MCSIALPLRVAPQGALQRSHHVACRIARRAPLLALVPLLAAALAACNLPFGMVNTAGQTTTSGTTTTVKVTVMRDSSGATLVDAPVYINNHGPYHFIIDTGASISVVDVTLADELALPVVGTGQPVSGVGGAETTIPIRITTWRLGQLTLPSARLVKGNLPGAEYGQGLQGLLGSDVWSRFGRLTIDYSAGSITVYRQFTRATSPTPVARRESPLPFVA